MTTIRPASLGLLKAREREARGGPPGEDLSERLRAIRPTPVRADRPQITEDPGPAGDKAPKRAREVLKQVSVAREAARGPEVEPQEVGRDLKGAREALEPTSAPGALDARFDAGIFFGYDIMTALARETAGQFVGVSDDLVEAAANTNASLTFQIGQDHVLHRIQLILDAGDLSNWGIWLQPIGQAEPQLIAGNSSINTERIHDPSGNAQEFLNTELRVEADFPIWVQQETQYHLTIRTGGGGGTTVHSRQFLTRAPDGVKIPGV